MVLVAIGLTGGGFSYIWLTTIFAYKMIDPSFLTVYDDGTVIHKLRSKADTVSYDPGITLSVSGNNVRIHQPFSAEILAEYEIPPTVKLR